MVDIDSNIHEEKWNYYLEKPHQFIIDVIRAIAKAQNKKISVLLTNDNHIHEINKKFRGVDKPTNVLAFPYEDFPDGTIGDIILALETIKREAEIEQISFKQHTAHMLIHGVLHLLGYMHDDDDEAEVMESLEKQVIHNLKDKGLF